MSYILWKIERTPLVDEAYDENDTEEITRYHDVNVRVGLGDTKDSFEFKVTNFNNEYFGKFRPRDRITLYRTVNSETVSTDDLMMIGTVRSADQESTADVNALSIEGYNYGESVMDAIVFSDPRDQGLDVSQALQSALNSVQNDNPSFSVTWHEDNPDNKKDNTSFPQVEERWFYKPFKKILNKYSTNEFTEDGRYNWYVDKNNKLLWIPESNEVDYTYNQLTDPDTKEISIGKDTEGIVNFVIVKGGSDPKGSPITARAQDYESTSRHGLKFKHHISDAGYARTTNAADMVTIGGDPENGPLPSDQPEFSYPTSAFKWLSAIGETEVTDDDDYVKKFRAYIRERLRADARDMIENRRFGKLVVEISVTAGSKNWGLGDLVNVSAYNVTLEGEFATKELRVMEIDYGTDIDMYTLSEDEGTI